MATNLRHVIAATGSATVASGTNYATSTTPTSEIAIGKNQLVRIVPTTASFGVFVRFGPAGTNTAGVNDIYIPYGVSETFDMGSVNSSICLYATGASTCVVSIVSRS
jgi:hypothetical protein